MELKTYFAQDAQGNVIAGAQCHLYTAGTTEHVGGLMDAENKPLPNPFTSADNGLIQFSAPNGLYDLQVISTGLNYTVRVQCQDLTEIQPNNTNMLTKCLFGRLTPQQQTEDYTCQTIFELEADFLTFRVGIPNIANVPVENVRVCVGVTDQATAPNWMIELNPSSGWMDVYFNGEMPVTLPPALGQERWSITWSDPIELPSIPRTDGGIRPLVMVRIEVPNGGVVSVPTNGIAQWRSSEVTPRYFKAAKQAVLGVTDKYAYTNTTNSEQGMFIPLFQYTTYKEGKQILLNGDSTVEGVGSLPMCYGAVQRVAYEASTPDFPIEYFNAAVHAQPPSIYHKRIADVIDDVKPTHVVYQAWSGNDVKPEGIGDDAVRRLKTYLGEALRSIRRGEARPDIVLLEGLPTTPEFKNTGANDAKRVELNEMLQTITGTRAAAGYAAAVSGPKLESGQIPMRADLTSDGAHPNSAGYELLKAAARPYFTFPVGVA